MQAMKWLLSVAVAAAILAPLQSANAGGSGPYGGGDPYETYRVHYRGGGYHGGYRGHYRGHRGYYGRPGYDRGHRHYDRGYGYYGRPGYDRGYGDYGRPGYDRGHRHYDRGYGDDGRPWYGYRGPMGVGRPRYPRRPVGKDLAKNNFPTESESRIKRMIG